jgi:hypothetical protein
MTERKGKHQIHDGGLLFMAQECTIRRGVARKPDACPDDG